MSISSMNITYVEERISGSCSDSGASHTGILYSLYNNISDWAIIPLAELNCSQTEQFAYGSVFGDNKNTLVHMHPQIKNLNSNKGAEMDIIQDIPFDQCARLINFLAFFTFLFLIVFSFVISKSHLYCIRRKNWDASREATRTHLKGYIRKKILIILLKVAQVVTRQGFDPGSNRVTVRLLWILLMVHTFVTSTVYFCVFKTNLFRPKEVTRLNNLHDLAASKNPPYRARFAFETNTWKLFASSKSEPMKSIWKRANETGSALLHYTTERNNFAGFLNRSKLQNWAVISSFPNNRFFVDAYCLMFEMDEFSDTQLYHSKETFLHSPTGIIFRKDFDVRSKREITISLSRMSQHGFNDYYDKNPQGLLRKFPIQLRCYRMLQETAYSVPEERVNNLALAHYTRLIQIHLTSNVLASVTLVCEFIWKKMKKAKLKPQVHPEKRKSRHGQG